MNDVPPSLDSGEIELQDSDELIWRNVNPKFIEDGKLSSQVFRPTQKDVRKLSGARQQIVDADRHYDEFTQSLGLDSCGVWAVSVEEAQAQTVRCVYDAESSSKPEPCPAGHTYLDFRAVDSNSKIKKIGIALRDSAEARGRQHP